MDLSWSESVDKPQFTAKATCLDPTPPSPATDASCLVDVSTSVPPIDDDTPATQKLKGGRWIRLTEDQNGFLYGWNEAIPAIGGSWEEGDDAGTSIKFPAAEANQRSGIPAGIIVRAWPGRNVGDAAAHVEVVMEGNPATPTSEVQSLYFENAVGGSFILSLDSIATAPILFEEADSAAIQSALTAIGADCLVAGAGTEEDPFLIVFVSTEDLPLLVVDIDDLASDRDLRFEYCCNSGGGGDGSNDDGIWIELGARSGSRYAWLELIPQANCGFVVGEGSGTTSTMYACEVNGNEKISAGTIVRAWPGARQTPEANVVVAGDPLVLTLAILNASGGTATLNIGLLAITVTPGMSAGDLQTAIDALGGTGYSTVTGSGTEGDPYEISTDPAGDVAGANANADNLVGTATDYRFEYSDYLFGNGTIDYMAFWLGERELGTVASNGMFARVNTFTMAGRDGSFQIVPDVPVEDTSGIVYAESDSVLSISYPFTIGPGGLVCCYVQVHGYFAAWNTIASETDFACQGISGVTEEAFGLMGTDGMDVTGGILTRIPSFHRSVLHMQTLSVLEEPTVPADGRLVYHDAYSYVSVPPTGSSTSRFIMGESGGPVNEFCLLTSALASGYATSTYSWQTLTDYLDGLLGTVERSFLRRGAVEWAATSLDPVAALSGSSFSPASNPYDASTAALIDSMASAINSLESKLNELITALRPIVPAS